MSNELKQRKKASPAGKQNEETKEQPKAKKGDAGSSDLSEVSEASSRRGCSLLDLRNLLCLICLVATGVLTWLVFQQSTKFADVEEKYWTLLKETADVRGLGNDINLITKKCENVQHTVDQLQNSAVVKQIEHLQEDLRKMKIWSDSISEKREELQENLTSLFQVVARIEQSTTSIAKDFSMKISAIKTDVRRISGLESDVFTLSDSLHQLEEEANKIEKRTVHSIGDLLASSIERITQLKSSVSRNSDRIDILKNKLAERMAEHSNYAKKLLDLDSSRAKILKTVTFANDLKPKIHNIKTDFALLHPQLDDLILRIGRLASELSRREKEIDALKEMFSNLTRVKTEIIGVKDQVTQIPEMNELLSKKSTPGQ